MSAYQEVRDFLQQFLNEKLGDQGRSKVLDLSDDFDLLTSGLTDSLDFVEMIVATADHFGREIDFEGLDPEQMTIVGPLCAYIAGDGKGLLND